MKIEGINYELPLFASASHSSIIKNLIYTSSPGFKRSLTGTMSTQSHISVVGMSSKSSHKAESLASCALWEFWAAGSSEAVTSSSFACWSVSIGSSFSSDLWTSTRDALETLKMPWIFTLTLTFTLELDPSVWGVTFWTKKWAKQRGKNQTLLINLSAECKANPNCCWQQLTAMCSGNVKTYSSWTIQFFYSAMLGAQLLGIPYVKSGVIFIRAKDYTTLSVSLPGLLQY